MEKNNKLVVSEFIEEVYNKKQYDKYFNYCSKDCVLRMSPYIGIGLNSDDTSGKNIVTEVAQKGPAAGKIFKGDEIIRVVDQQKTWQTFEELRSGGAGWGQGVVGSSVTLSVKREGKEFDVPLVRGRVEGFEIHMGDHLKEYEEYALKYWPDAHSEVKILLEENDMVAIFLVNSGTNLEYNRSAIWDECDIYRLQDGRIVEIWTVENQVSLFKQLGYQIQLPVK